MRRAQPPFHCIYGRRGSGKSTLLRLLRLALSHRRAVIVDPMAEHDGLPGDIVVRSEYDPGEALEYGVDVARSTGARLLVVDEADMAWIRTVPGPRFIWAVRYSRHHDLALILAVRRAPALPPEIRSQASDLWTFRQSDPVDLDYFHQAGLPREQLRLTSRSGLWHAQDGLWHFHKQAGSRCVPATGERT